MRRLTRERAPTAKRSRRGRAQEQKPAIGPAKRLRFTRTRQRARHANEALGRLLERIKRLRFTRTRQRARHANEALGRLLERIKRAVTNIRPPLPDTEAGDSPTKSLRASVLSATLCLGVAALLVSGKIVEIADRMPLGPDRDRWLEVATETDRMANRLALNRPYDLLRDLQGAGGNAGRQIDVIGDVEDLLQLELDGVSEQPPAPTTTVTPDESAAVATTTVPTTETPATDTPATDTPATDTPATDPPATDPPATDTPATDPPATDTPATDTPATDPPATDTPATDTPAADTTTTTTAPTTVPPEPQGYRRPDPVSAEAPLRTFVAGDSQAFYLGHRLRDSRLSDVLEITLNQLHSTGLARPSYFNWPVHFFAVAAQFDPEVVVATLGSNDWQSMAAPEGQTLSRGSDEWRAEWRRRLGVALDVLEAPHRQVIWVGLPPTRSDEFREGYAVMNQIAAAAVAERDFVTMIDIWDIFGGDEPYRDAVPPPGDPEGRPVDVRQQDGVHLNQTGSRWVVDLINDQIERIIAEISPERTAAEP